MYNLSEKHFKALRDIEKTLNTFYKLRQAEYVKRAEKEGITFWDEDSSYTNASMSLYSLDYIIKQYEQCGQEAAITGGTTHSSTT